MSLNLEQTIDDLVRGDETLTNENANKDSLLFSTQRDLIAGAISKEYALNKLLPTDVARAHKDGSIYVHDLDYTLTSTGAGYYNCMLIDYPEMLKNGFKMGNADIESPKSFRTACDLIPQIVVSASSNCYGGMSLHRFDEEMEPYARLSLVKHLRATLEAFYAVSDQAEQSADIENNINRILDALDENSTRELALTVEDEFLSRALSVAARGLKKEIDDSYQSVFYSLSSMGATSGQTPFVSLNFGLGKSWFAREIQRAILENALEGLGKEKKTAVFPKLLFTLKPGLNVEKQDPNYDIKQLALQCASKRMYPDILSHDKIVENYKSFLSPMGCLRGDTLVRLNGNEIPIGRAWDSLAKDFGVKKQPNGKDEYIDIPIMDSYKIADSSGQGKATPLRMVKNYGEKWVAVGLSQPNGLGGRLLVCTTTHPLPVKNKGRVLAKDLVKGDVLFRAKPASGSGSLATAGGVHKAWMMGAMMVAGSLSKPGSVFVSYSSERDGEKNLPLAAKTAENSGTSGMSIVEHKAGEGAHIRDFSIKGMLLSLFGEASLGERVVPKVMFDCGPAEKLGFIAGTIDAGGVVCFSSARVSVKFAGASVANSVAGLLESLSVPAIVDTCAGSHVAHFELFRELAQCLKFPSDEEANVSALPSLSDAAGHWEDTFVVDYVEPLEGMDEPAYDFTTTTDFFDANGVLSHNCRSFLTPFVGEDGEYKSFGRRNIGVCTVNLPDIAIKARIAASGESVNGNLEALEGDTLERAISVFYEILDERMQVAKKALDWRYNRLANTTARNAPILYQYGATGHRLEPGEHVQPIFDRGEATASIGYIGLHEVALTLFGKGWQSNERAKDFTLDVLRRMKYWGDLWTGENRVAFSLYSTPAESLTHKYARSLEKHYGPIKGVTDKGYITNSFHYDVQAKISPFDKIDFETPYTSIATGGNIVYVELPKLAGNLQALEELWDYAIKRVNYFGVNHCISKCYECEYDGDFDADAKSFFCPQCGNRDEHSLEIVNRLCGYLGEVASRKPISGRTKEILSRVKHS